MTRIEKLAFYLKHANDEEREACVGEILAEEDFAMAENAYRTLTQLNLLLIEQNRLDDLQKYKEKWTA